MATMNISLDERHLARLRERAAQLGKRVEDLIAEMVSGSLDEEEAYRRAVREGLEDARAGRVVPAEEAFRSARAKLGTA